MNFGEALTALKAGKKLSRAGWNGKDMFLVYVPGTNDAIPFGAYKKALDTKLVNIEPHIDIFTAAGKMQPGWLASQSDMLAEDWGEV